MYIFAKICNPIIQISRLPDKARGQKTAAAPTSLARRRGQLYNINVRVGQGGGITIGYGHILFLLLLGTAGHASAYSWDLPARKVRRFRAEIKYWSPVSSAEIKSHIITPADWWIPPTGYVQWGTTDSYEKMDASVPLASLEVQPIDGLSLCLELGRNKFSGGELFMHDWLKADNATLYLYNGVV